MPKSALFAQSLVALFVLVVLSGPVAAQDFEPIDFDLPDGVSIWQYILLLFNLDEVVETVAFYAFLLAVLLIVFGLTIALRQVIWTAYSALAVFGLIYVALNDQNISGIHWTGVEITPRGLLVVGHFLASANFIVAAFAIPRNTRLRMLRGPLLGMAALSWPVWWLGSGLPLEQARLLFNGTAALGGLSHAIPFSRFRHLDGQLDHGLRLSALVLTLLMLGTIGLVSVTPGNEPADIVFASRLLILAIIGFLVVFFIRRVFAVRQSREQIIQKTLQDAKREAEINRQLAEMERKHAETREVARLQRMRLATASHDIRQPIMSLRTTMDALSHKQSPQIKSQLRDAFDYLDQLAGSYMEEARGEALTVDTPSNADDTGSTGPERLSSALLFASLDRMFTQSATQQNSTLKFNGGPADMLVHPLPLMRILSNLITNAIKHSTGGTITVSLLPDQDRVTLQVSNPGALPPGDVFAPYAKGAASKGEGLGLAIVLEQARAQGYDLAHVPDPACVIFQISVPAAPLATTP